MSKFALYFKSTHFPRRLLAGYTFSTKEEAEDFKARMVSECLRNEYWVEQIDINWDKELKELK